MGFYQYVHRFILIHVLIGVFCQECPHNAVLLLCLFLLYSGQLILVALEASCNVYPHFSSRYFLLLHPTMMDRLQGSEKWSELL